MPRLAVNYNNVIFYKIVCLDLDIKECYVGHTTNFTNRKSEHKRTCKNENHKNHNTYLYRYINIYGGWENWEMIMIEQCKCDNHLEALKKERDYMELLKASLNSVKPTTRTTETQEEIDTGNHNAIETVKQDTTEKQTKQQNQINDIKQMIIQLRSNLNQLPKLTILKRENFLKSQNEKAELGNLILEK